jgi:hypothetical protein
MKRIVAVALAGLAATVLGTGCHEPHSFMVKRPADPIADNAVTKLWTADIKHIATDGDWLLTRGYFATSDVITALTGGEDISHASIYDAKRGTVIEAVHAGGREVTLEELLRRNHHVIVVHPSGMTDAQRTRSVARARSRLGAEFDTAGMIGLDDKEKVYCSELVWWASEGELRTGEEETVITPNDLIGYGSIVYWSGDRTDQQILELAVDREHVAAR